MPGSPLDLMYVLVDHRPVRASSVAQWAEFMESARFEGNRRVAETVLDDDGGRIRVSTVFLGLDHGFGRPGGPVLFETMVFGGSLDGEQRRYETWEAAQAGHDELVARLRLLRGGKEGAAWCD